jgi:hypothetical protein
VTNSYKFVDRTGRELRCTAEPGEHHMVASTRLTVDEDGSVHWTYTVDDAMINLGVFEVIDPVDRALERLRRDWTKLSTTGVNADRVRGIASSNRGAGQYLSAACLEALAEIMASKEKS